MTQRRDTTPIVKIDLDKTVTSKELQEDQEARGEDAADIEREAADRGIGAAITGVDVGPAGDRKGR